MDTKTINQNYPTDFLAQLLRGAGQVMFMENAATGALFLIGILVGSWLSGTAIVALGGAVGLVASTLGGHIFASRAIPKSLRMEKGGGKSGLWGYNGILVGCALTTFFESSRLLWTVLVGFSFLSPYLWRWMNKCMNNQGISALTFPFIFLTWIVWVFPAAPEVSAAAAAESDFTIVSIAESWLKGLSQVFLVCSPVCGLIFLTGLLICDRRAATWCAIGSLAGVALATLFQENPAAIANGLYGFNPALTGIAIGAVFRKKTAIIILAIISTFFIQICMAWLFTKIGLPTLTAPFCAATWLTLLLFRK